MRISDWSSDLCSSDLLNESRASDDKSDLEAMLAKAADDVAARLVVGPYAFEVVEIDGILQPLSAREIIRAAGPTVRSDHRPDPAERAACGGPSPCTATTNSTGLS